MLPSNVSVSVCPRGVVGFAKLEENCAVEKLALKGPYTDGGGAISPVVIFVALHQFTVKKFLAD